MAEGTYRLIKENAGATFDEKTVLAESGKVLGFDASLNPVMYYRGTWEDYYWYGIEIDESASSPDVTRIASDGDMVLHNANYGLPCHNNIKACLQNDDGTVNYYLKPTDWSKKIDENASDLSGTDGQVMIEWPAFYYKVENNYPSSGKHQLKISPNALTGFTLVPKHYVSAYEAVIQRSTSKLGSFINTGTDYRGGNNTSAWDAAVNSLLGKPVTYINRTDGRTYARNRGTGWDLSSYGDHKWLFWFYVIEYATLNSQKAYNGDLTVDGYRQGGLGNGVTTADGTEWNNFNTYNPFINCGASNSLASGTGEVSVVKTDFGGSGVNRTFKVPRYRGHENPFGHIWKILDGINIKAQAVADGGQTQTWVSYTPADWNDANYTNYANVGNVARVNGYMKTALMGAGAEFVPSVATEGSDTTYYCDYYYQNIPASGEVLRMLLVGGYAPDAAIAGLTASNSLAAPSTAFTNVGFRLRFQAV
jgi:hypothetical protein